VIAIDIGNSAHNYSVVRQFSGSRTRTALDSFARYVKILQAAVAVLPNPGLSEADGMLHPMTWFVG